MYAIDWKLQGMHIFKMAIYDQERSGGWGMGNDFKLLPN